LDAFDDILKKDRKEIAIERAKRNIKKHDIRNPALAESNLLRTITEK
jgi:hypothetical protein